MHLNMSNSFTHLLDIESNEELNVIRHSPYSSDDELIESRMNFTTSMNILSMNCQSLHAKFDYVRLLIDKFKNNNCALQVVCLQESWFSADTDLSLYMIPGYHLISTGRYASNHGGLVIYLNTNWDYKVISDDTVSKLWERQIVEIIDPNNKLRKKIIVGNIYRPPYNSLDNLNTFMAEFNSTLLEYHANGQNTYMCGDYNVDLLKINSLQFNENYFYSILSAGYIPTITLPTRLSENSTLIDNIFTTNLDNNISACILNIHISDHQPVVLFVNDDQPPTKAKYITVKSITNGAKERFRTSFHNKHVLDQLDDNIHVADPNQNYAILENALKETHCECFPERRVKFNSKKHKKNPWMTVGILKSINQRNKLYKKFKQTSINSISYVAKKTMFNRYRNTLKKTITLAKLVYYKNILIVINTIFNDFFSTIGESNEKNIRKHNGSHFQDYLTNHTDCHFAFHLINNNDTIRIIEKIKLSKSKGHDGVSTELLKLINNDISNCITLIINQSLTSCIYPDSLKVAKVTPIYKKR